MVRQARARGYLVIGVTGGVGKRRCYHGDYGNDVPNLKKAIHYVKTEEKLHNLPLFIAGNSAGGRVLGHVATKSFDNLRCIAPMSAEIPVLDIYPRNVAVIFMHMSRDAELTGAVKDSANRLKDKKVPVHNTIIHPAKVDQNFLVHGGMGLTPQAADKVILALKENTAQGVILRDEKTRLLQHEPRPLLNNDGTLAKVWRNKDSNWATAVQAQPGLEQEIGGTTKNSKLFELLNIAWAEHASPAGSIDQVLDFCEAPWKFVKEKQNKNK